MMGFLSVFRKAAPVAIAVTSAFNPMLGAVLNQVLVAERALPGPKRGPEKKKLVTDTLFGFAPLLVPMLEQAAGRDLVDDEEFTKALGELIDVIVRLVNSIKAMPVSEPKAAA